MTIRIECEPCPLCDQESYLDLPEPIGRRVITWALSGAPGFIQEVFPELNANQREQLMTGSHPRCFDKAFGFMGDDKPPKGKGEGTAFIA